MAKSSKTTKRTPGIARGRLPSFSWKPLVQALAIVAAVGWIYGPALHGAWLWDDDNDITQNFVVRSPDGLWMIWFEPSRLLAYYPITFSVEWIEWHLWGMDTIGYHLVNVTLHIISSLLVWRLFSKFGLRLAWLGGLIFAIHPVQVESIAWIAEVKNALCLPPFLLAMCAWIDYEERKRDRDYFLALGLFLVAMLCKTSMASFPVVILLYAWWKRGRISWSDLKAGAPFLMISLAVGFEAFLILQPYFAQETAGPMGGLFSRLACAGLTITFYFSKCFLPVNLMPIYPLWPIDPPSPAQFLPWPILLGAIYGLWTKRQTWGRHALLGLGFFLILLAPFLGLVRAPYMGFTWVMDHELYISIIGLIGLVVAAMGQMEERLTVLPRRFGMAGAAMVLALLTRESRQYTGLYANEVTLWTYAAQQNPESWRVHANLGTALLNAGRMAEGIEELWQTLRLNPNYSPAHNNLGVALQLTNRIPEAIEQYEQSVRIIPQNAEAHNNLGYALAQTSRLAEAIAQYEEALRLKPDFSNAHNNLGVALQQAGRWQEARDQFERALQINPNYAEARANLERLQALEKSAPVKP